MNEFTIYCTAEQTKKAIELGAPITRSYNRFDNMELSPIFKEDGNFLYAIIPTAEQMIGWLEEKMLITTFYIPYYPCAIPNDGYGYLIIARNVVLEYDNKHSLFSSRKEATLAAIDAALEYLSNNKK